MWVHTELADGLGKQCLIGVNSSHPHEKGLIFRDTRAGTSFLVFGCVRSDVLEGNPISTSRRLAYDDPRVPLFKSAG